ncbi:hypothetical protein L1987_16022 [Smallanthus sonchifolius]|uniref:Uncharacterized protein n=1 Tax=Smallanthus sonchifolius TaxID=185202 RepID=A0ACB9J7Q5_9ASTR|nr:hypothetical protein L1987_16022 [Smallanthus sonchifolius]
MNHVVDQLNLITKDARMAKVLWIEDEERFDQRHSAHPKCMSHVVNKIRKLERKVAKSRLVDLEKSFTLLRS